MAIWEVELVCEARWPLVSCASCSTLVASLGEGAEARAHDRELRLRFVVPSAECGAAVRAARLQLQRVGLSVRAYLINAARPGAFPAQ